MRFVYALGAGGVTDTPGCGMAVPPLSCFLSAKIININVICK